MARTQDETYEAARTIALALVSAGSIPADSIGALGQLKQLSDQKIEALRMTARTVAETAVRLLNEWPSGQPMHTIDIEALVRDLEACLHVAN